MHTSRPTTLTDDGRRHHQQLSYVYVRSSIVHFVLPRHQRSLRLLACRALLPFFALAVLVALGG